MRGEQFGTEADLLMEDKSECVRRLTYLLHVALGRIQSLCREGNAAQALALAEAVQSLPESIADPDLFSEDTLVEALQQYQRAFPRVSVDFVTLYRSRFVPDRFTS